MLITQKHVLFNGQVGAGHFILCYNGDVITDPCLIASEIISEHGESLMTGGVNVSLFKQQFSSCHFRDYIWSFSIFQLLQASIKFLLLGYAQ